MEKATRFSLESLPPEWAEWCREHRPDLLPYDVFDRFKDFWKAKPGKDGTKLDWFATWRNWIRSTQKSAEPSSRYAGIKDKPLPERSSATSPAYVAFKAWWQGFKSKSQESIPPDHIGSFIRVGCTVKTAKRGDFEAREERAAIQAEGA